MIPVTIKARQPTYENFIYDQLWHYEFTELQLRCWQLHGVDTLEAHDELDYLNELIATEYIC